MHFLSIMNEILNIEVQIEVYPVSLMNLLSEENKKKNKLVSSSVLIYSSLENELFTNTGNKSIDPTSHFIDI